MFRIRGATQRDLSYLDAMMPMSTWETLSPQDREAAGPERIRMYSRSVLQSLLAPPASTVGLIAEVYGRPVGYLLAAISPDSTTGEPHALLVDLYVTPQARRRGIGRALHGTAMQQFAHMGIRKMKMVTDMTNQGALRMAETAGFKPEGLIAVKEWE